MSETTAHNDREELNRDVIDTIVVDPDDVIKALRINSKEGKRTAVLRITPPFETQSRAEIYLSESGTNYPPEMSPQPLHIDPELMVESVRSPSVVEKEARENARHELDDPTEEEINEWIDGSMDVWEDNIQSQLVDDADLNDTDRHPQRDPDVVSVKYGDK